MKKHACTCCASLLLLAVFAVLPGCDGLLALYGIGGNANPNTGGEPAPAGTQRLTAITFSPDSGFPQREDPATFEIGGGSITASGGSGGTLGQTGLYADDRFAWDFLVGSEGSISFDGLNVVAVDGYWVHPDSQSAGATLTANFSGGGSETRASAPVVANGALGQAAGFFDTVSAPDGETITGLTFSFGDEGAAGDLAALDVLELTVTSDQ